MRRWAAIGAHTSRRIDWAVASSSPPPLKHCAPPLADPGRQSSACSAAVAGNNSTPLHSTPPHTKLLPLSRWPQRQVRKHSMKAPTVLPKQLKKYKKTTQTESRGNSSGGSVTVPGGLRRVVYTAPQASAGYRGCIPWWRRSHHPGSPLQPPRQEEKKQQISSSLWTDSLSPLCVFFFFFFPPPRLWADRIDFPPACGCISLSSASSLPRTLPPLPPPRLTCSLPFSGALSLSLSPLLSSRRAGCQSPAIYTPSCLLSRRSLIIHE